MSMSLFYIIHKNSLPYPYIYILFGLVFFIGIHIFARRQPDPLAFLVLLFPILVINMAMSGVRQAAAIGIICIALVAFMDRRPFRFLFWVIISSLFHSSAIVFLLLLPFASGHYNNNRIAITLIISLIGALMLIFSKNAQYALSAYDSIEGLCAVFRWVFSMLQYIFYLWKKMKQNFLDYNLWFGLIRHDIFNFSNTNI